MEINMENIILCKDITKKVGKYKLENINFDLKPGYIMGIIGRNGSGKTSLLRSLMGSYRLDKNINVNENKKTENSGDIIIGGISIKDNIKEYKEQIAFVFCDTPFETVYSSIVNGEIYGKYYTTFDMDKYISLLNKFEIPIRQKIERLSKGQQIKQQLAFALSYDAKVYFFDEPTGNLDVEFRALFYKYIREIVADGDKSVIYASHLVEEMEEFADYILWIESDEEIGRTKFFGSIEELRNSYRIVEADDEIIDKISKEIIVGGRKRENHKEVLIRTSKEEFTKEIKENCRYADLKEIMYYVEKGEVL